MYKKWRQKLHIEPPQGWLNDPNGLCFFNGKYHVYFQYTPDSADGAGKRCWGHYESADMLNWDFTGIVFRPDIPEDRDGVYSGSALACGGKLHIFYTGNVKEKGNYDYITAGRGANVIHSVSSDGRTMSKKNVLLRNSDYPDFCSCHVRDPKVWEEGGIFRMVLGARSLQSKGGVLFYKSSDLLDWEYDGEFFSENFGYMWECPDCFTLGANRYLSVSPQGLVHEEYRFQNAYSSGYFRFDGKPERFEEWDYGFDFYAPQTFLAPDGRRIIIGWMGMGDIPYTNPTTELGWQHCLTLPREISADENGYLLQSPIRELEKLRSAEAVLADGEIREAQLPFDFTAQCRGEFSISLSGVEISWRGGVLSLEFRDDSGCGRKIRRAKLEKCGDIRIVADMSGIELYADRGRKVMSSRFYPDSEVVILTLNGICGRIYSLDEMRFS